MSLLPLLLPGFFGCGLRLAGSLQLQAPGLGLRFLRRLLGLAALGLFGLPAGHEIPHGTQRIVIRDLDGAKNVRSQARPPDGEGCDIVLEGQHVRIVDADGKNQKAQDDAPEGSDL